MNKINRKQMRARGEFASELHYYSKPKRRLEFAACICRLASRSCFSRGEFGKKCLTNTESEQPKRCQHIKIGIEEFMSSTYSFI